MFESLINGTKKKFCLGYICYENLQIWLASQK